MNIKQLFALALLCLVHASCKKARQADILPPGDTTRTGADTIPGDTIVEVQPVCNGQPVLKWEVIFDDHINVRRLASDTAGNVYVGCMVGRDIAEVDADPGPGVSMVKGGGFIVIKMNAQKEFIWAKHIMGLGHELDFWGGNYQKLEVDNDQRVYISIYWHHRQLGGRYNTYIINTAGAIEPVFPNTEGPFVGSTNFKGYDINGNAYGVTSESSWPYAPTFSKYNLITRTVDFEKPFDIGDMSAAASGSIYAMNSSEDKNTDFDDGPAVQHINLPESVKGAYTYLLKLDASGNFVWVKYVPGQYESGIKSSIYLDANENPFVLTSDDHNEFITKFSSSGQQLWSNTLATYSNIVFDNAGNWFTLNKDRNLTRFNAAGSTVWSVSNEGEHIALNNNRDIYTGFDNKIYKYSLCE
ncbi:hypothetical protein DJ568_15675 [Mucilaginibacter hurinus]|uniref:Uncharacterized protein n=1 Tax=Mucilaginibacter hurinus TaxID=2201324 RepID=A0A367GKH3_9SPHI|nr:hypothetical protein [Mucilaginibacter hurinus]RCH53977.1 hypothetical protein DJ568_15675 [Mucilaginibacter hurinus]